MSTQASGGSVSKPVSGQTFEVVRDTEKQGEKPCKITGKVNQTAAKQFGEKYLKEHSEYNVLRFDDTNGVHCKLVKEPDSNKIKFYSRPQNTDKTTQVATSSFTHLVKETREPAASGRADQLAKARDELRNTPYKGLETPQWTSIPSTNKQGEKCQTLLYKCPYYDADGELRTVICEIQIKDSLLKKRGEGLEDIMDPVGGAGDNIHTGINRDLEAESRARGLTDEIVKSKAESYIRSYMEELLGK